MSFPIPTLLKSLLILLTNHLTVLATSPPHIASPESGDRLITDTTPTFRFIASNHAPTVVKVTQYLLGVYEVAVRKDHKLITSPFPYTIIRHPSYTFLLLLILGLATRILSPTSALLLNPLPKPFFYPIDFVGITHAFLTDNAGLGSALRRESVAAGLFVLVVGAGMVQQVLALNGRVEVEEKALREEFGREWDEYVKRTWKFIPGW